MRRFLLIAMLLVVIGGTTWTLLNWNEVATITKDPWRAIPQRSAIIVEIPDAWNSWDRFTHTSQLWSAFEKLPAIGGMGRLMARVVERMENDATLKNALTDVPLLISVTRTGGDAVDVLFSCVPKSSNGVPMQAFVALLKGNEATAATLNTGAVVQVRPDTALGEFSLCVRDGLWLLASSPAMMDEALLQLETARSAQNDTLFNAARATLGMGSQAHVLVHVERTQALMNTWWTPDAVAAYDLPTGWVALDLSVRADAILMSGLVLAAKAHPALTSVQQQGMGRNDLLRWLPASVSNWDVQHVEDAELFLQGNGFASEMDRNDLGPVLFNWVHGTIGRANSSRTAAGETPRWALFQTDDPESAIAALNSRCPDGGACDTLSYRGKRLTRLPLMNGHAKLLGPAYSELERPWWCMLGDVAVFATEPGLLRVVIDAWNDGRTLAEDARTAAWTEQMATTSGRSLRWDIARCWTGFANGMKQGPASEFSEQGAFMQQFGGLSVQLSPAQHGYTHVAVGLEFAPLEERSTGVLWTTPVGAGVVRKPEIMRNHTNGSQEVLVQDVQHRLHLISSTGKHLWERALDGPILGEVHQVDRFRNGKLQYLFNTAERVYLVDRNGKDVGDLPVKLPAAATAPLAVFDYDGQRDYRVLVPVADGRVLNYGLEGSPVKGWEPPRCATASSNAVHHVRIRNKDHLIIVDGNGKIQLLDRRGEVRERTDLDIGHGAKVLSVIPGVDLMGTRMIFADTTGALYQATLAGARITLAPAASGTNGLGATASDGNFDLVRISNDSISVHHGGKQVFTRSFGATLEPDVDLYDFGKGKTTYGVVLPESGQVTLLNSTGVELEGLPLPGASRFSIGDLNLDGQLELVTVLADGHVTAYRLSTKE